MQSLKNALMGTAVFAFLLIAGSLFHVREFVMHAAALYSSPTSDIIQAYRRPYQALRIVICVRGANCTIPFTPVPAGYRLVLHSLAVQAQYTGSAPPTLSALLDIPLAPPLSAAQLYFPSLPAANPHRFTQEILTVVDAGVVPTFQVYLGNEPWSTAAITTTLIGDLENCSSFPGGVCPPVVR